VPSICTHVHTHSHTHTHTYIQGFTCEPNSSNPVQSNCTGTPPSQAFTTDLFEVCVRVRKGGGFGLCVWLEAPCGSLSLSLSLSHLSLSTLSLSHSLTHAKENFASRFFLTIIDLQIVRLSASKNSPATGFRYTAYSWASCSSTFRDIRINFFFFGVTLDSVTNCDWR